MLNMRFSIVSCAWKPWSELCDLDRHYRIEHNQDTRVITSSCPLDLASYNNNNHCWGWHQSQAIWAMYVCVLLVFIRLTKHQYVRAIVSNIACNKICLIMNLKACTHTHTHTHTYYKNMLKEIDYNDLYKLKLNKMLHIKMTIYFLCMT